MRHPKIVPHLTVLVALAAMLALGGSPSAHAGGKNQIRGVAIRDEAGATTVRIQGTGTPTFTVYKLERPTRVVVDVAQATLDRSVRGDEPSATFAVGSWAVSQVAAMAMEDGSTSVRVVVTLARPGRYDVKADGKDVVVKVTARDPAPVVASTAELEAARAEVARLQAEAVAAKKKADDAAKMASSASSSERAEIARLQAEAAAAKKKVDDEIAKVKRAADAEIAKARADADAARADAARTTAEAQAKLAKVEADRKRIEAEARAAERARDDAKAAAARADERERGAREAEAKAAAERKAAQDAVARARASSADDAANKIKDAEARLARAEAARVAAENARKDAERTAAAAKKDAAAAQTAITAATTARSEADAATRAAKAALAAAEAQRAAAEQRTADTIAEAERAELRRAQAEADAARAVERRRAEEAAAAQAATSRKTAEAEAARAAERRRAEETAAAQATSTRKTAEAEAARAAEKRRADEAAAAQAATSRKSEEAAAAQATSTRKTAEAEAARAAEKRRADEAAAAQAASTRKTAEAEAARAAEKRRADEAAAAQATSTLKTAEAEAARAAEKRRADEAAAAQAASTRKTAEAEAARAAERRRIEEAAAAQAASARKTEEAAAARAKAARLAEEQAMQAAASARTAAESRKQAAERAADDVERAVASERDAAKVARDRKRAADDAEAEARDNARRKASADEIAAARAEAQRLTAEREKAERELADRTKEVSRTRAEAERLADAKADATAEVTRLKQAAAEARDARAREEAKLAEVTKARVAEEQALAKVRAKPAPVAPAAPVRAEPADRQGGRVEARTAQAPVAAKPTARITAVRFTPADNEHAVVVDLDGKGATAELVRTGTRKAELVVHGATLPTDLARTLDTTRFGGPIKTVSSYTDPKSGDVRVVVELASDVTPRFDTTGGDLRLAFAASSASSPSRVRTQSVPGPVVGGFGATSTPVTQTSVAQLGRKKVYRGPTIDLDFKDADIHDLMRTLGDVGRVSIVIPEEVRAQVTVRLKRVPWDQALDVILASKGLGYRREGNIYRIAPQKQLDAEDEAEAARLRALVEMEAPKPEIYTLNYTDAGSVKPTLEPLLSPKGKIEVDKRTNSIVVNDVSRNRREIIDLAHALDTQTPQISIEARIVEARSQYERQIGIQWGGRALAGAAGGNATGLIFPSTIGLTGGATDQQKSENGVAAPADFAVNLPANGTQGALGLTLGSVGGNVNINLRLSALEETGTVRIISAPKVTVLNNIEAEMKQGVKIPISIVSAEGTQTQFVRAELSLKVTPYVSQRDCAIMMDVQVTKDEPDFVNTGARGDPTILNKEAKTRMLVNDGETSVMGGIYTRNSGLSYSKIPFFADIPVFGWLFKRRIETDDRAELLIFITPKITNKASLRCAP